MDKSKRVYLENLGSVSISELSGRELKPSSKPHRVIFCDIDGVLNSYFGVSCDEENRIGEFSENNLLALKYLLKETGAELVLCSSWVDNAEIFERIREEFWEIDEICVSDFCKKPDLRKDESIYEWCKTHKITNIEEFVVLDDEPIDLYYDSNLKRIIKARKYQWADTRSVRVSSMDGLNFQVCKLVFELFNIPNYSIPVDTENK